MYSVDIQRLKEIFGEENVRDNKADLYVYGSDASVHEAMPQVVARPQNTVQVQKLLQYADSEKIPVIPRGSGSGMCGQAVPVRGGIILDMKGMNRILEINTSDGYCRVEPGVIDDDLNRALKSYGVFYPPTPASGVIATIGGELANNSSGTRSVKYGAARDAILSMKVVLASGDCFSFGSNTRVAASGYSSRATNGWIRRHPGSDCRGDSAFRAASQTALLGDRQVPNARRGRQCHLRNHGQRLPAFNAGANR